MASRQFYQFQGSLNPNLVFIEGSFQVGASGAVAPSSGIVGAGNQVVTKVGTGSYRIQLQDPYNRIVGFNSIVIPPSSAAGATTDGSLTVGSPYQIIFPSTSTKWTDLGLPFGVTPTLGQPFVATSGASAGPLGSSGVTAAGNGTVAAITLSNVQDVQLLPNPNLELQSSTAGSYFFIQTMGSSAYIPVQPTSGTVIRYNMWLRNSNLLLKGETSTNY